MALEVDELLRLNVNQPNWHPNAYLFVKRRYFRRPDGHVFVLPETEDWHIRRVLAQGFVEVEGPGGPNDEVKPLSGLIADQREAELSALREELARLRKQVEEQQAREAQKQEVSLATSTSNAPGDRQMPGANARPARR